MGADTIGNYLSIISEMKFSFKLVNIFYVILRHDGDVRYFQNVWEWTGFKRKIDIVVDGS